MIYFILPPFYIAIVSYFIMRIKVFSQQASQERPKNQKLKDTAQVQDQSKKTPTLSEQYKKLENNVENQNTNQQENKNQIQEQLNKVKTEISQKTQQQLKDFAKANPDLKQPRIKKEQQTLQR